MQRAIVLALVGTSMGLSPRAAFLVAEPKGEPKAPAVPRDYAAVRAVEEEGVGPNLHFAPVSTTMKCTINLTLQYMAVFTALGICRSYLDFKGRAYDTSVTQTALKHASETVFYAPMACLLFVAFRMRVLQLTKGQGNPQEWVQMSMQGVAYAILANTIMVLLIPVVTTTKAEDIELDKHTGELKLDGKNPFENSSLATVFNVIRYVCFALLYVGFGGVVAGLFLFEPDPALWPEGVPSVSPAVFCTCMLSCAFFAIYCLLAVSRTYSQFTKGAIGQSRFEEVMLGAADTLAMAPMLCVLFLGARMRALQMDPVGGNPQRWAQNCFYLCTWALIAQCCVAVIVPLLLEGRVRRGAVEGDIEINVKNSSVASCFIFLRWVIMISLYTAAIAVVCSVFTIEHPQGPEFTPPVSPTMQCVINLAFQYFFIYSLVWVLYTLHELTGWEDGRDMKEVLESAKATVQFAPMLCVLFIATRMRALQITNNKGSPQGYVQDGMYLASWAVVVQFVMCLIMPFFTGRKFEVDTLSGHDKPVRAAKFSNWYAAMFVTVIRYTALLGLLGGLTAVIAGVFLMTPENANGSGNIPFVGKHVARPPMASDMPGVKGVLESTGEGIGGSVDAVQDGTVAAAEDTTSEATHLGEDIGETATAVGDTAGTAVATTKETVVGGEEGEKKEGKAEEKAKEGESDKAKEAKPAEAAEAKPAEEAEAKPAEASAVQEAKVQEANVPKPAAAAATGFAAKASK